jgi:hypothetical protein
MSPDPYKASGGAGDPGSWNRYAYVLNDPINSTDHTGTQVDGDSAGTCGVDASSPLCNAIDGSGSAGGSAGSGSGGGCVLDGVGTDCTFVDALARAGALDQAQGALAKLAQNGVAAEESSVQGLLNATPCASLFNLPSGVTPWSVLQNQVVFTYFQENDPTVCGQTKTGRTKRNGYREHQHRPR